MATSLFRISVLIGFFGMGLGIFMGIRQDFTLALAHAHLNLLGFVTLFLSALYYRVIPGAEEGFLAKLQATVSVVGAIAFPIGLGGVLTGINSFEPVVIGGSLTVLIGMFLFVVVVFRTSGVRSI